MALIRRKPIVVLILFAVVVLLISCERPLANRQAVEEEAETTSSLTPTEEVVADSSVDEPSSQEEGETEQAVDETGAEEAETEEADTEETAVDQPAAEEVEAEEPTEEEASTEETAAEEPSDESPRPAESEAADSATSAAEGEATTEEEPVAEGESVAEEAAVDDGGEDAESAAVEESESEAAESAEATEESVALPATHTVARGENLYQIGLKYGLPWALIAQANNIYNANYIYAGQVLTIPGGVTGEDADAGDGQTAEETSYTVRSGDSLFTIGQRFGVGWVEIAEANGLINPNQIIPGQLLKIPGSAPGPTPEFTHVVQSGETLFRISLLYGVNWVSIAQENEITSPFVIYEGQTLVIPGG